jgi:hypothetical protein
MEPTASLREAFTESEDRYQLLGLSPALALPEWLGPQRCRQRKPT